MTKPWERYWYTVQIPRVAHFSEHGGQWWVYASDTPSKDSPGSGMFGYLGPPISEGDALLASAAPELYRALDSLRDLAAKSLDSSVPVGRYEMSAAVEAAEAALRKARGEP